MFNYESLGVYDLYEKKHSQEDVSKKAVKRIKEAWEDREVIMFERLNGTFVYIMGAENRKQDGEWFIKIEDDGFPDEIIGTIYDLIEYMQEHLADWFEVLEV